MLYRLSIEPCREECIWEKDEIVVNIFLLFCPLFFSFITETVLGLDEKIEVVKLKRIVNPCHNEKREGNFKKCGGLRIPLKVY